MRREPPGPAKHGCPRAYVSAVVLAWGAGLALSGSGSVPGAAAVLLALPLAGIVAVRVWAVPESRGKHGTSGTEHGEE
jgi:hypothetical protein